MHRNKHLGQDCLRLCSFDNGFQYGLFSGAMFSLYPYFTCCNTPHRWLNCCVVKSTNNVWSIENTQYKQSVKAFFRVGTVIAIELWTVLTLLNQTREIHNGVKGTWR